MKKAPFVSSCPRVTLLAALGSFALFSAPFAHATDLYWGGALNTPWLTAGNWFTDLAGTNASASVPTVTDDLFFGTAANNSVAGQTSIAGNISARSLTFTSTGTMRLSQSSNRVLTLGTGGITVNSGAGAVTIGESSGSLSVQMLGSQTWTNNSSATLSVRSPRLSDSAGGASTLTANAASSGNISFVLAAADSPDAVKALSIVVDSAGTGAVQMASASHTGGTTIKRGILQANGAGVAGTAFTFGSGKVFLGDTSGNANARLTVANSPKITSNIDVQAGSTGIKTLTAASSAAAVEFSGNIALYDDLLVGTTLTSGTNPTITMSGVVSGGGDLTVGTVGTRTVTLVLSGDNTYSGNTVISAGGLNLSDTGSLTFNIGANGVNNSVTGTGSAAFNGTFVFDLTGAAAVNGNSWNIVSVGTLSESFTSTFLVQDFIETAGVWTNGAGFSFTEATGVLSYSAIPEPSTCALLGGVGTLALAIARRRRRAGV